MKAEAILKYSLLAGIVLFYLIYTIKYSFVFKKNPFFTGRRKAFHAIMIWLFPFCWILILKSLFKPTPGSSSFQDKKDPEKFDDNTTSWVGWAASTPTPPKSGNEV
jgi:hypothetical protein